MEASKKDWKTALMADELDGWDYVAVLIDADKGYAVVRVYDDAGNVMGEL